MHDIEAIIAEIDERGYCCVPNVISPERADAARLQAGVIFDADPTPTSERQSYTRLVGVDDPYPRTLTGFEAVTESRHISGKKRGGNTEPGGTDSEL